MGKLGFGLRVLSFCVSRSLSLSLSLSPSPSYCCFSVIGVITATLFGSFLEVEDS